MRSVAISVLKAETAEVGVEEKRFSVSRTMSLKLARLVVVVEPWGGLGVLFGLAVGMDRGCCIVKTWRPRMITFTLYQYDRIER